MTQTNVVSQPSVPAGEAVGGHAREAGREAEGETGFEGLLSSLVAGREKPAGGGQAPEGAPSRDLGRRMAAWLGGNGAALEGEGGSDVPDMPGGELSDTGDIGADDTGEPSLVLPGDVSELTLVGTPDQSGGTNVSTAALNAPVPVGIAPEDPGAPSADARQPLPEDVPMPSERASVMSARATLPNDEPAKVAVATATVLGRETHLAPPREAALLAGQLQKGSNSGTGGPAAPESGAAGTQSKMPAANTTGAFHPTVTPTGGQDTGSGTQLRQGREESAGRQASTDAQAGSKDAPATARLGPEQAGSAARTDAPANVPPIPSTPVQQIAARIASEAGAAVHTGRPDATAFVSFAQSPHGAPVRVLQIQLQPVELGTVTVRISLKDQALRLDVEVGRGDTAQLIQRERETLSALLRTAGYLVDGLDVRIADQTASGQQVAGGGGQSGMQAPGDGQGGSSQADGRSQHARPQEQRRGNPFGNGRNREDDQAGSSARRSDLYV